MIYVVLIYKSVYFNVNVGALLIMFHNYYILILLFYCGKSIKLILTCDSVLIIVVFKNCLTA